MNQRLATLYGIVDCARDPRLFDWVQECAEKRCLLGGNLDPEVEKVSPHIVNLEAGSLLYDRWRRDGWGQAWGILCRSSMTLDEVRRHLRKFLQAELPDGRLVLFRFYDPRVWQTYWPLLTEQEQGCWLSGIEQFISE